MYASSRLASPAYAIGLVVLVLSTGGLLASVVLCDRPAQGASTGVLVWWGTICLVSVFNVWGWKASAVALSRRKADIDPELYKFQRWQLFLSAAFVLGCAFRSFLPRADVQRIGLFDSWLSSVMVGRSVATVAELCFAAQWALVLNRIACRVGSRFWEIISWSLVPLILVAELCSWWAVLSTCYLGNTIEESIWALSALIVSVSFLTMRSRCPASYRPLLCGVAVLGVTYVLFMVAVDIPMYASRWLADEASGRAYLSLTDGLWDLGARRVVTFAWEDWRSEIPWMTLYFSVGVWCSLALVHVSGWNSQHVHQNYEPASIRTRRKHGRL